MSVGNLQSLLQTIFFSIIQIEMYHQPTFKKQVKKPDSSQQQNRDSSIQRPNFIQKNKDLQSKKKLTQKNINNVTIPKPSIKAPQKSIPQKVEQLQKVVERLSKGATQPQLQKLLLQQIKGIKSQLKEIKQQIGLGTTTGSNSKQKYYQQAEKEEQQQIEQDITNLVPRDEPVPNNMRISSRAVQDTHSKNQSTVKEGPTEHYNSSSKTKELIDIGKVQPYMKQFKLDPVKLQQPFYRGYHKKSSKPIIVKYCGENGTMDGLINLYQKLWKNIVKAKKVCINKIYDLNQPLANYIMALQMNRFSILQIEMDPLDIIKDVLRAIQFIHECGYLYRNIHPDHVMANFEGNVVLLDFKLMRRYADIKGKYVEVRANVESEGISQFVSNSRLRGLPEGRKDDLQCLGYLALYLLERKLPWNINNIIQVRSKCTLQQLYGKYGGLLEFMIAIHKMSVEQCPNYDRLHSLIML